MTYDGVNIGEAVQPIQDRVESLQSNGYAVVSPGDALSAGAYAVSVNSGNLDASDTLSVGSSNDEVLFDGSTKSLSSATNVRINSVSAAGDGTEQYRYDVIYADSSGEVQRAEGSVTKLDSRESQNNLTRFERFKGAIPNPGTDSSVIIAAVIVNSNDSSVSTSQLRDYRVSATHKVSALETDTVETTALEAKGKTIDYDSISNDLSDPTVVEKWDIGNSEFRKTLAKSSFTADNTARAISLSHFNIDLTVSGLKPSANERFTSHIIIETINGTIDDTTVASSGVGTISYSEDADRLTLAIDDSGADYEIIVSGEVFTPKP